MHHLRATSLLLNSLVFHMFVALDVHKWHENLAATHITMTTYWVYITVVSRCVFRRPSETASANGWRLYICTYVKNPHSLCISMTPMWSELLTLSSKKIRRQIRLSSKGPLAKYVKLRDAHAPGIPGTFPPPPTSKEIASYRHARAVMHVGITSPQWRGKRSRHPRRMRIQQFYVSVKRPMVKVLSLFSRNIPARGFKINTIKHPITT